MEIGALLASTHDGIRSTPGESAENGPHVSKVITYSSIAMPVGPHHYSNGYRNTLNHRA